MVKKGEQALLAGKEIIGKLAHLLRFACRVLFKARDHPCSNRYGQLDQSRSGDVTTSETVPDFKEALHLGEHPLTQLLRSLFRAYSREPGDVPDQMSPAELKCTLMTFEIGSEAVTTKDSVERFSKYFLEGVGVSESNLEDYKHRRNEYPKPPEFRPHRPARLVYVDYRKIWNCGLEFLACLRYGLGGFFEHPTHGPGY